VGTNTNVPSFSFKPEKNPIDNGQCRCLCLDLHE